MALLVPDVGEAEMLATIVGKTAIQNLVIKLFATNVTPAEANTAGSFTEAAGGGYASKTLTGASWTISGTAPTSAGYAQQTWTFTGALTTNATIYGYYVVGASDGILRWAELLPAPFTPANNGDLLLITPTFTLD